MKTSKKIKRQRTKGKKRMLLISIFLTFNFFNSIIFNCFAQDIHFSQFNQEPLFLNPALTGGFNGDQRAIINYKNQWQNIAPYRTYAFSFDMGLMKRKWENNVFGVGLTAFSDKAGDAQMGTTQFNLSFADFVSINSTQQISAGLQVGFGYRGFEQEKLKWENQYNMSTGLYDQAMPSKETEKVSNFSFLDVSTGIQWNYSSESSTISSNNVFKANAGIAVYHANKPQQRFYTNSPLSELHPKIIVHGGTYIGLTNTAMALLPSFLFLQQGPHYEVNVGMFYRQTMKEESKYTTLVNGIAFYAGGYYRVGDAIFPAVMLEMGSINIGISYDVNISSLKAATQTRGGIEIALRYINPNPFHYSKGGINKSVRFL